MAIQIIVEDKDQKKYAWPCTFYFPKDGGGFTEAKATAQFKMLGKARIDVIINDDTETDTDILDEVLVGWGDNDFVDGAGTPLLFNNEDHRRAVLNNPCVISGFIKGYFKSIQGRQAKAKK